MPVFSGIQRRRSLVTDAAKEGLGRGKNRVQVGEEEIPFVAQFYKSDICIVWGVRNVSQNSTLIHKIAF